MYNNLRLFADINPVAYCIKMSYKMLPRCRHVNLATLVVLGGIKVWRRRQHTHYAGRHVTH